MPVQHPFQRCDDLLRGGVSVPAEFNELPPQRIHNLGTGVNFPVPQHTEAKKLFNGGDAEGH